MAEPVCSIRCTACTELGRCAACEAEGNRCCTTADLPVKCTVCALAVERVAHGHPYPVPHKAPAWLQEQADAYYLASGAPGAVGSCPGYCAYHISGWSCWVNGCGEQRCGPVGHFDNMRTTAIFARLKAAKVSP